jgi:hypothetical protein
VLLHHDEALQSGGARAEDLDVLPGKVAPWAAERGLVLVPAVPDGEAGLTVSLGEHIDAEAFVQLAADAGARLLYMEQRRFEVGSLASTEEYEQVPGAARQQLEELVQRAGAHHGRVSGVELVFCHGGVLHSWDREASWHTRVQERLFALASPDDDPEEPDAGEDTSSYLSPERVRHIVDHLVALPEFKQASSQAKQRAIAWQVFPELGPARNSWAALERAGAARLAAEEAAYLGWEEQLPALAAELAVWPQWQEATNARTRSPCPRVPRATVGRLPCFQATARPAPGPARAEEKS